MKKYVIRNKDNVNEYYCHGDIFVNKKELMSFNNKHEIMEFYNIRDIDDALTYVNGESEEFNRDDCIAAIFYVRFLEESVQKREGISLKESFNNFRKEQNKGKFLFSDLKKIINEMSEEELDQPVNIEVMGPMTYEQHNIVFTNGREMKLGNNSVKSTSDCFVLNSSDNLTIV